ncbi:elongation factor G [Marimonas sp. MJW-29]|uniref:Elongation factor G n=1 Tax=Sulfitobacter sediminis TaxID=3234186 RepID=A0ABV3RRS6_9RHOB
MRAIGVIGPSQSGKSTLIDGIAGIDGARSSSLTFLGETAITPFDYIGDAWAALEVPGGHDAQSQIGPVLAACDAAVLCVPAAVEAAVLAAPYLRLLDEAKIPTFLFINKIDVTSERVADIVASLQHYCRHGIVLRQVPIRVGDEITGVIDLISERAWAYHEGCRSSLVELPENMREREEQARSELLEAFADYDDSLLEQIIEDKAPVAKDVYSISTKVLQHRDLVPAFLGSATLCNGFQRLLKSLRHEVPSVGTLRDRLSPENNVRAVGCLGDFKKHLGKISLVRALEDGLRPKSRLGGSELGNLNSLDAKSPINSPLKAGEFAVAIKSDHISPGGLFTENEALRLPAWASAHSPALRLRIHPKHEKDEGKLATALPRLSEIDPGLELTQDELSGSQVLGVQGPQHLNAIILKLADAFGINVESSSLPAELRETIQSKITIYHRHRKQSGGAGQFADVVVDVSPLRRGSGFAFAETVKGGAVPRNYIPSVEAGARDALSKGPSGFPVVDIKVELKDGKSHSVDSSDFAFRTAGYNAVKEALETAGTTILQPITKLEIQVPSVFDGALVQLVSSLRGQVLGFDTHPASEGWDVFGALLPMVAEEEFSLALSSATRGTAWFHSELDHFEELREPMKRETVG